jgi:DNA-binding MarR family transcriptional regulator
MRTSWTHSSIGKRVRANRYAKQSQVLGEAMYASPFSLLVFSTLPLDLLVLCRIIRDVTNREARMKTDDACAKHDEEFREALEKWGVKDSGGIELMRTLASTNRMLEVIADHELQAKKLSMPRLRLLLWLQAEEAQVDAVGVSPSHLSHCQQISKNTVSSLLRSLEEQGLIERTLSRKDKRRFHITLSPSGRDLVRSSLPGYGQAMKETLACLSPKEKETLGQLLRKLHQSLLEKASASGWSYHREEPESAENGNPVANRAIE